MQRMHLGAMLILASQIATARADDVRYYNDNGVTFRETRRVVRRPVSETRTETREETVYRERYTTQFENRTRICHLPVTEYRWETRLVGRWNPFVQPYLENRLVPRTHLEPRTETYQVPVVQRELVPERRIVQTPVTDLRFVEEEQITRVAVSDTSDPFAQPTSVANRQRIGGIAQLDSDPPRYGNSTWQTIDRGTVRR